MRLKKILFKPRPNQLGSIVHYRVEQAEQYDGLHECVWISAGQNFIYISKSACCDLFISPTSSTYWCRWGGVGEGQQSGATVLWVVSSSKSLWFSSSKAQPHEQSNPLGIWFKSQKWCSTCIKCFTLAALQRQWSLLRNSQLFLLIHPTKGGKNKNVSFSGTCSGFYQAS